MITHVVKSGDTLSGLAYKYQTTTSIIMADNPIITSIEHIEIGWNLKIRSAIEYAQEKSSESISYQATASTKSANTQTGTVIGNIEWEGGSVSYGQIGKVTLTRDATLWSMGIDGKLVKVRSLKANEAYKVYSYSDKFGGLYNVGGNNWVYAVSVKYQALTGQLADVASGKISAPIVTLDQTKTTSTNEVITLDPSLSVFENPYYRRPVFQAKKTDGDIMTMEMRVLSVNASYSNQIQQNKTNSGFFINLSGYNLPVLTISGAFLDTKTNREFDDFLDRYLNYIQAYKSDKYYSFSICTFYFKNREYKGLVASFNYSNEASTAKLRNFSMQFLVLKDKRLVSDKDITSIPTVVKRGKMDEETFLSDLASMLTNPITGLYGESDE